VPDLKNPQYLNRYTWALNNPLRYTDPSGHSPVSQEEEPHGEPGGGVPGGEMALWAEEAQIAAGEDRFLAQTKAQAAAQLAAETIGDHYGVLGEQVACAEVNIDVRAAEEVGVASQLREAAAGGGDMSGLVQKLADMSTRGSGDRLVLGKFVEGGGYIKEAQTNGGRFFLTGKGVYEALGDFRKDLAWAVNEQVLKSALESGIDRVEFVGESIKDVLQKAEGSARYREVNWMLDNADRYGYKQVGNSWIKVPR
jgi:hypothetical protein